MNKLPEQETSVIDPEAIKALGLDIDQECEVMMTGIDTFPPRIRIEHSSSGRHRLYLDVGESYDPESVNQVDLPNNEITGIVCYSQFIRALWAENEASPRCSAIDNKPTVAEPITDDCMYCAEGRMGSGHCKQKIRLLLLTWIKDKPTLLVFNLSPTSIKHWRNHVSKLARSKAPYISVVTRFSLQDTKKNSFRWAEVIPDVERVVTQEELENALEIREVFKASLADISDRDYDDPGDKSKTF